MRLQLEADLPHVMIEPAEITQAVTQLLVNALNYTPDGGEILLTTYKEGRQAVFRVTDNGIGIAPSDIPMIFERFYRADKARSTETGGSGVGLTIAKKIVESHGGRLWVESTLGDGSSFFLSLPLVGMQ
jgi:signal transduction histidine kinase